MKVEMGPHDQVKRAVPLGLIAVERDRVNGL